MRRLQALALLLALLALPGRAAAQASPAPGAPLSGATTPPPAAGSSSAASAGLASLLVSGSVSAGLGVAMAWPLSGPPPSPPVRIAGEVVFGVGVAACLAGLTWLFVPVIHQRTVQLQIRPMPLVARSAGGLALQGLF